jgi:hypothetical protein
MNAPGHAAFGALAGAAVALGVALAFVPVRGEVGNVNVALALAVVVVAAGALGRRLGGATTAAVAAISFAFFHTQPYGELRVTAARDVITVALLLVLGVTAGDLSARSRLARSGPPDLEELRRLHRIAARAALGDTTDDLTLQACAEMIGLLRLRDCWFEPAPFATPLPDGDTSIVIDVRGQEVGRFVLAPTPGETVSVERELVARALADQVRVALAVAAA